MKLFRCTWENGQHVYTLYHTSESGKRHTIQFALHANRELGWWVNTHNYSTSRLTRREVIAVIRRTLKLAKVVKSANPAAVKNLPAHDTMVQNVKAVYARATVADVNAG